MPKFYIFSIFLLLSSTFLYAFDHPFIQYNFNYLTEDNGLTHNFVDDIYKDSHGYLWFATHNGLTRYDGYNFLSYNTTTTPVNLKGDLVYNICEDNFKRLWIATEKGIDIIDLEIYCNAELTIDLYSTMWNMMNTSATHIYKDTAGNLWISAANNLYCIEFHENGEIKDFYGLEKGISSTSINAIADLGWGVCAGINNCLMCLEKNSEHLLKTKMVSPLFSNQYDDWKIQSLEADDEDLWIGTNYGLYKYNHFDQQLIEYNNLKDNPINGNQLHITDIRKNDSELIFIGTLNGLIIYNKKSNEFIVNLQDNSLANQSLNCNYINCILPDNNELWVGTEIGGINYLSFPKILCQIWQPDRGNKNSLSSNPVSSVCEDKKGNLWIGTIEGGLNLKRKDKDGFEHFKCDKKSNNSLINNSISGLLIDSRNYLWAYTWGMGISKININDLNNLSFKNYSRGMTQGLTGNFISSACEDTINNGIWFGTTEGLHFYDNEKETFQPVRFNISGNNFDSMNSLCIDRKHRLWIGTSRGVFIINLFSFARSRRHFDYKHITEKLSDSKSSNTDKINCIYEDGNGIIWIGCNGSGLYKLESDENDTYCFSNYTLNDGLPNNNIIGILEDNSGNLWFSTNQGISQLTKSNMVFNNYSKHDGLQSNQFYRNAYYYSKKDNLLYFGNTAGLVAINPNTPIITPRNNDVLITELSILGETIYPVTNKYIKNNISIAKDIFIHEKHQSIELSFSSRNYDYNKQIRYAYRLKGYEKKWNELKAGDNTARYSSISPGNYTFEVYATDNKGNWLNNVTSINIHVEPYFYKAWWFLLIMFLIVIFLARYFYIWKVNSYRRQKEILENTVEERTAKLSVQNKQLIDMSRKLANTTEEKIAFFTNITHEFRTPVTLINGPLDLALRYSKDPLVTEQIQLAERSSKYLLSLVNELMDFRKIDSQKVVIDKKEGNFITFIDNILIPFRAFAKDRQITITTYIRLENENLILDYEYMKKVIINLVSNALKFTPDNGKINIYVASLMNDNQEKIIYLGIEDNGNGIDEDDLDKIFDRFYQSKKTIKHQTTNQSGTGIGLYLCQEIIHLHGGSIRACNNKNKGATIRITLPYIDSKINSYPAFEINKCIVDKHSVLNKQPVTTLKENEESFSETILVVDDNPDMRCYIKTLLHFNYKIVEAENGMEALQILKTRKIDLILSDLMMPVMNGIELSKEIKANITISHIPFIMLTAVVAEEQKKEGFQIGVDYYLCKPFDEEVLLYRIRNIFAQQRKYKSLFAINMNCNNLNMAEESKDKKFIAAAMDLMNSNYNDCEYEIEHFVRDLGYSKTLVNKKLQDLIGQSTGQFMKNYRLKAAHEMLTQTRNANDINISDIAYSVGFNDPKYFTKCFKELYKVLPSTLLNK